jgi:hypothetical protein
MKMSEAVKTWKISRTYTIQATDKIYAVERLNQAIRQGNEYKYLNSTRVVEFTESTKKPKKNNPWLKEIARQIFKSK